MTKKEMTNEIYKKYYEVRFFLGFYCEGSAANTPERAERFAARMRETEAKEKLLLDLTDKLQISPVLKEWSVNAFESGFNAKSVSECVIPDDLTTEI
jgi:hypothetical protein